MDKKTVSAIMLALLLTSMLTLAFNIQPVKAEPTTIVVPDDYPTIQEAINAASSGDTISVKEGIYYEHVSVSKRVSLVGENRNSTIIDGNGTGTVVYITADDVSISQLTIRNGSHIPHVTYGIEVHSCNNVIIKENIISKNDLGIFLYYSDNNIVEGNLVFDNWQGVSVTFSDHNYVVNNYMSANEEAGICMGSAATNNMIYDNEINDNGFCGICIGWSTHNEIVKNVLNYNGEAGIRLDSSDNNRIVGNHLALNTRDGIVLFGSNLNTLMKNEIIQNQWDGIALWYSNSNKIYHNNLLENGKQARSYSGSTNTWDDNYPSGGNYWSDYTGMDADGDGKGDIPYVIDAYNQDRYPLMHPWSSLPVHNINTGLGYATIQEAINAPETLNGHTIFVEAGTYYENVVVKKSVALFGENKNTTVIVGVAYSPVWESVIFVQADDVKIANLTVANGGHGIYLGARRSIVTDCAAYGNGFGLTISSSSQNFLRRNLLFNNSYNLLVLGLWSISDFIQDIDSSNYVNGKPVYYLVNEENLSINPVTFPSIGYLAVVNSTNVQIANISLSRNGDGLLIAFSPNTLIENVEATHNFHGISLKCSPRTNVKHCNFSYNQYGILLYYSDNVNIKENNISRNEEGIYLMCSNHSVIYHNDFIENYRYYQVLVHRSYNSCWDDDYPSGGNYWSDYVGVDVKSGPAQDLPGSDGIGDTPYIIDADNTDHYPLMNPYGAPPLPTYNLTIAATVGGTTDPVPETYSYTANSTVQVTAIPEANYLFDYWKLDGVNVGSANPYSVLMNKNHVLKAVFSPIPPPLSASISPLSASILVGQSVTFTSTVSGGYTPYSYQWYLNDAPVSGATSVSWTFTPTSNGIYYIYLKVTDAKGNTAQSDTARITVTAVPVGGYSFPIQVQTKTEPIIPYIALIAILTAIFTKLRPKTKRKR